MPSVFPSYPSYKEPACSKVRSDPRSLKRAPEMDSNANCSKKRQRTGILSEVSDLTSTGIAAEPADNHTAVVEPAVKPLCDSSVPANDQLPVDSAQFAGNGLFKEQFVFTAAVVDEPFAFVRRAFGKETDPALRSAGNFLHHRKCREKERALQLQILKLKQTVDKYEEELCNLKDNCNISTFLDVTTDAQRNSVKAAFVIDQLKNPKVKAMPTTS